MPRIEFRDSNGCCWRMDSADPAKIGPWLGEMLTSDLVANEPYYPAQVTVYPLSGEDPSAPSRTHLLTDEGRKKLVEDLAAMLGLEVRGLLVKADGGVRAP